MYHAWRLFRVALHLILAAAVLATAYTWITPMMNAQANDPDFEEALERINTYRSWIGIEPIRMHPSLMEAAQSHADYYALNNGQMPGLHNQTPGAPGYSGATMSERAENFGYDGSINENVGLSGSILSTVDWSIATINHRLTLIDPRYTDIGFGTVNTENGGMETIKLGTESWSSTAEPAWQAWPVDGTTNVGLSYLGSAPSPFSNVPYPVGYPVTLKYHGDGPVEFHSATLTANGAEVPILSAMGDGWLTRNTMMILATDPLDPHTTYQVTIEASANGEHVTHSWSFTTGESNNVRPERNGVEPTPDPEPEPEPEPSPPDENGDNGDANGDNEAEIEIPERLQSANPAFQSTWAQADGRVHNLLSNRTWLWGPDTFLTRAESYAESPGGEREIAYFDKSRMEINNPDADSSSQWYVTNGLLVREMIEGVIQVGDQEFIQHEPAQIAIAGDNLANNPDAPTYGSLRPHSAVMNDGNRQPDRTGEAVMTRLIHNGTVHHGPEVPEGVHYGHYDDVTGFNVADVFWGWISGAEHYDWHYAVGHPITDPHWVYTLVNGDGKWVLVQAFERRLLTFTPENDPEWQLEMGNVGRHYYAWRYGEAPPQ
jgi:uncharacterized protein YkwD